MVTWMLAAVMAISTATPAPVMPAVPEVPRPEQIMAVPPELRAQLQQQVIDAGGSREQRLERLVDFMFREPGLGMRYAEEATLTVAQAYRRREANCLTFTLMTVALAREMGLHAYGQQIEEVLAWREEGGLVRRTTHVNAGISIGATRFTVDVAPGSVPASRPPMPVTDQRLFTLYYNNRTAEILAGTSPMAAAPFVAASLRLDPAYADSWNSAGVLHGHEGDQLAAERDYLKALALDPDNASALFNLVALYQKNGDQVRSAIFQRRLEKAREQNPYYLLLQARDDEQQGLYALAVKRYKKAIRLHDSEPRFYLGLARAYRQLGDERRARDALNRADALNRNDSGGQERVGSGDLR